MSENEKVRTDFHVSEGMLGYNASKQDALRMVELLNNHGFTHVKYGAASNDHAVMPPPVLWAQLLDEVMGASASDESDEAWEEDPAINVALITTGYALWVEYDEGGSKAYAKLNVHSQNPSMFVIERYILSNGKIEMTPEFVNTRQELSRVMSSIAPHSDWALDEEGQDEGEDIDIGDVEP